MGFDPDTDVKRDVPLWMYTTMGIGGAGKYFVSLRDGNDLPGILDWAKGRNLPLLVVGGGSNLIVGGAGFDGLVLKMDIKGVCIIEETQESVDVQVNAGEVWDDFVELAVQNGWWGVENMSLIPGSVGAVAIQNVGAYGQEARRIIQHVNAYDTRMRKFVTLANADCEFGFRRSIFNTVALGRYVILSIVFRLNPEGRPNLSRPDVVRALARKGLATRGSISQRAIRQVIVELRSGGALLPKPESLGNAGTFFRAGIVRNQDFLPLIFRCLMGFRLPLLAKLIGCKLKYPAEDGFKLPSRILIEACGLQRARVGDFYLYENNCAVLVHAVKASKGGDHDEFVRLIQRVRQGVYRKTGIIIPIEPYLVGFSDTDLEVLWDR